MSAAEFDYEFILEDEFDAMYVFSLRAPMEADLQLLLRCQ